MKKTILASLLAAGFMSTNAQMTDTVSVGASYVNQIWYSLENDNQGSAAKNNWDLAFDVTGYGSTVLINTVNGVNIWKYPKADATGWATVDTTGMSAWTSRSNSDTSWAYGAIGRYADPSDPYDLDWGKYNVTTHVVTGDSLFIVKLADGTYRKFMIETLTGNVYNCKYANLDGTNPQTLAFDKTVYSGKNFGYYSLQNNASVNREPLSANWDLLFGQYSALIPTAYTVTGVLSNSGVEVAKMAGLTDLATNVNWSVATFKTEINTIGYNWKTFNGTGYSVQDSLLFFVKPLSGDIWKVVFTGFGGSTTGNFIFTKQKIYTNTQGVPGMPATTTSVALYPNPAFGQNVTVVYSLGSATGIATITVYDVTGKAVVISNLDGSAGVHQYQISASLLKTGMYIVDVKTEGGHNIQKLIVQ